MRWNLIPNWLLGSEQILFDCRADGFSLVWRRSGLRLKRTRSKMPTRKWKMPTSCLLHNNLHYNERSNDRLGLIPNRDCRLVKVQLSRSKEGIVRSVVEQCCQKCLRICGSGFRRERKRKMVRTAIVRPYRYMGRFCPKEGKNRRKVTKIFQSLWNLIVLYCRMKWFWCEWLSCILLPEKVLREE